MPSNLKGANEIQTKSNAKSHKAELSLKSWHRNAGGPSLAPSQRPTLLLYCCIAIHHLPLSTIIYNQLLAPKCCATVSEPVRTIIELLAAQRMPSVLS